MGRDVVQDLLERVEYVEDENRQLRAVIRAFIESMDAARELIGLRVPLQ